MEPSHNLDGDGKSGPGQGRPNGNLSLGLVFRDGCQLGRGLVFAAYVAPGNQQRCYRQENQDHATAEQKAENSPAGRASSTRATTVPLDRPPDIR